MDEYEWNSWKVILWARVSIDLGGWYHSVDMEPDQEYRLCKKAAENGDERAQRYLAAFAAELLRS